MRVGLVPFAVALLLPSPAWPGWSFIATATGNNDGSGTTLDTTTPLNVAAGDLLVGFGGWIGPYGSAPTYAMAKSSGSPANTFTCDAADYSPGNSSTDTMSAACYVLSATADSTATFRLTIGASFTYRNLVVIQLRPDGGETVSKDASNHFEAAGGSTTTSGTITTTGIDEVVLGLLYEDDAASSSTQQIDSVSASVPGGSPIDASSFWYRILTATFSGGAATATYNSTNYNSHIIAFDSLRSGPPTYLNIADLSIAEPPSGTRNATLTVTLAPTAADAVAVQYATANGTAMSPEDYVAASGTLTFPPGTASQTIPVIIKADTIKEGPETFDVTLFSPTGRSEIARATATARIFDPGNLFTVAPCRLADTRDAQGPALNPGVDRLFVLSGLCGVPSSARAASVNVTVTGATQAGDLRPYAAGTAVPLASTVNYGAFQTRANNAIVPIGASGQLGVHLDQTAGTVHFILDVNGYVE